MKTRVIKTKIWRDGFFNRLSLQAKLVFIFLLTNEFIGQTGIYEMDISTISFYTGVDKNKIKEILTNELKEKIIYDNGWVVVLNALKHNNYASNNKQRMSYMKEWNELPEHLKQYAPYFNNVEEYKPEYIKAGSEYLHRKIAEKALGRKLSENEVVHHIDGNPSNNNISNLAVMDKETHIKLHKREIDLSDSSIILLSYKYDTTPKSEIRNPKTENINNKTENINIIDSIKEKEKENIIKEKEKEIIEWFNTQHQTRYKTIGVSEANLKFWLDKYSIEDIKQAIILIKAHDFWSDKMNPTILFRTKSPKGQPVDYIGQLLNQPKPSQKPTEQYGEFIKRLEIWKKYGKTK